jgi:hypothetical protein
MKLGWCRAKGAAYKTKLPLTGDDPTDYLYPFHFDTIKALFTIYSATILVV